MVVDGGYAKRPFLRPVILDGCGRSAARGRDAHPCDPPPTQRKPRQRGPLPTYGKNRIYLDEMAADTEDWQPVECVQ